MADKTDVRGCECVIVVCTGVAGDKHRLALGGHTHCVERDIAEQGDCSRLHPGGVDAIVGTNQQLIGSAKRQLVNVLKYRRFRGRIRASSSRACGSHEWDRQSECEWEQKAAGSDSHAGVSFVKLGSIGGGAHAP